MSNSNGQEYIDFKNEQIADEIYEWLEDKGFLCQECGHIMNKFRIQGEIQLDCPNCGETYVEKTTY